MPFVTILLSASAQGLYEQFDETCRGRLLSGCLVAENKACDRWGVGGGKGSVTKFK